MSLHRAVSVITALSRTSSHRILVHGILVVLLCRFICMGGRIRPSVCSYGHACRFADGRWSISTRGLCFECGDQRAQMSLGGSASAGRKRFTFRPTSTSERKAAHHRRFAERHVPGPRLVAAGNTLLIEVWAGRHSSVARWSVRFGCASVRIREPRGTVKARTCPLVVPAQVTMWPLNLYRQMDRILLRDFISDQAASGLW